MITITQSRERYASLAASVDWKLDVLRQARAVVVGAGALGNEVCKNLAMMGIRHITIVDMDTVEVSNLTRSVFFRESDSNRNKAEVIAAGIRGLNPDVSVFPIVGRVPDVLGLGIVRRADMVFSCLDNRLARLSVNRLCHKVGKPWVDGAMEDLQGEVAAYTPGSGPCYECGLSKIDWEILANAKKCGGVAFQAAKAGKVPTTSTMGSIVAALEVQEAIKLHQGDVKGSLGGRKLVINGKVNDFYITRPNRKEDCQGHISFGDIVEVAEWSAASTTPRQILERFEAETGTEGDLRLGFDLASELPCGPCGNHHSYQPFLRTPIAFEFSLCPKCKEPGTPTNIYKVRASDPIADLALAKLGVPALDVLEVTTGDDSRWYELTGDLERLPVEIR